MGYNTKRQEGEAEEGNGKEKEGEEVEGRLVEAHSTHGNSELRNSLKKRENQSSGKIIAEEDRSTGRIRFSVIR